MEIKDGKLVSVNVNDIFLPGLLIIPESVEVIDEGAFANVSFIKEVFIPNTVERIRDGAFFNCVNLERVTLPKWLEKIYDQTFQGCVNLKEVVIPYAVKRIGMSAFSGCSNLQKVKFVDGFGKNKSELTEIDECAFLDCTKLKSVKLPRNLKELKGGAFSGCTQLEKVKFKSVVEKIGDNAFAECGNLRDINVSDQTDIGNKAFLHCYNLNNKSLIGYDLSYIIENESEVAIESTGNFEYKDISKVKQDFAKSKTKDETYDEPTM